MNTYLQTSALLYTILIAFVYFSKKRIKTLENNIFKTLIWIMLYTILMDIISTVVAINYDVPKLSEFLIKTFLIGLVFWVYFASYYVYCISDPKQAGVIEFKEHPNKKHFIKVYFFYIISDLLVIFIFIRKLPIENQFHLSNWFNLLI